jgi:hypothetical protein
MRDSYALTRTKCKVLFDSRNGFWNKMINKHRNIEKQVKFMSQKKHD